MATHKEDQKLVLRTNYRLMQESILQYFRPSLRYHLSSRHLFCLFLSGRLKQVLLYHNYRFMMWVKNSFDPDQLTSNEAS